MPYHQIDPPVPGYILNGQWDSQNESNPLFLFEFSSRGHHLFTSVGRFFVSSKLKRSLEEKRLTGFEFTEITARSSTKKTLKSRYYEMIFQENPKQPDFYLYDDDKLAASDSALAILKALCGNKIDILPLDKKTEAEVFFDSFLMDLEAGKYDDISE